VTESWFELGVEAGPTAVGASLHAGAHSRSCRDGERATDCTFATVTTKSVTLEPEGIFERVPDSLVAIELRAIAEGTAVLTVVADNGAETRTFTRSIAARAVDRVTVTPSLRGMPCASPARFAIGMRASLPSSIHGGDLQLHGHGLFPIEVTGATVDETRSTDELLVAQLADSPGTVSLLSDLDPSFALAVETFAPAAIESITIGDVSSRWFPLAPTEVPIDLIVGGQPVCGDALSRTATVETPQVCQIYEADGDGTSTSKTAAGMASVLLRAYQAGSCTISVALGGTSVSATKTFIVTM
jgi:hypothetical protein